MGAFRWSWIALLALLVPAAASARIYKWTDESGRTVYANAPPAKASKVKNVQVVVEDDAPAPAASKDTGAAKDAGQADARRRQQELEQRIATLEREVQAMQYAKQYAPAQYAAPPPPPPDYYAGSYPAYSPTYYPPYYPAYAYPYLVVVRPVHRFFPPHFASRPIAFRHGIMRARR